MSNAQILEQLPARASTPAPCDQAASWPAQGDWTYEEYRRLPDDGWRYEVIRGVLRRTPAPGTRHQAVLRNLTFGLMEHLRRTPVGEVYFAPTDVVLSGLATPVQPDLLVVLNEHLSIVKEQRIEGAPDLIVEVLSRTNWIADRRDKYEVYAAAGVQEYWIVDPEQRSIDVFVLRKQRYELLGRSGSQESVHSEVLPGRVNSIDEVMPE